MQENTTSFFKIAYSVKELAKLVGVSERKIHDEIKAERLKTSRIGRRIVITASEVSKWLEASETKSKQPETA